MDLFDKIREAWKSVIVKIAPYENINTDFVFNDIRTVIDSGPDSPKLLCFDIGTGEQVELRLNEPFNATFEHFWSDMIIDCLEKDLEIFYE